MDIPPSCPDITVAGGDSEGATPPISAFFGDKPTVEIMNMMGFNSDGLGNHNFDRGSQYLRTELIPLATFPFLTSNIVDSVGKTPPEWKPSAVFETSRWSNCSDNPTSPSISIAARSSISFRSSSPTRFLCQFSTPPRPIAGTPA